MNNGNKIVIYGIIAVLSLGLIGYMATVVIPQAFVSFTKAAPASVVSLADSRLLADKILARADGVDQASINVYVLSKDSQGVANKSVTVSGLETVSPEVALTDKDGRVNFKLTSKTEGQFKLTAMVEGVPLPKTITVTFRN